MTAIQWASLVGFGAALGWELWGWHRRSGAGGARAFRIIVWLAAAGAIVRPNLVTAVARGVGIQRGADLVLYLFVIAFLVTSLYFYSRYLRLQTQIIQLARGLALRDPRIGGSPTGQEHKGAPEPLNE